MLKCTANRLTTLLVLLLFLGLKSAYAQDLSVTITVPLTGEDRFSICGGERLMTVRVENTTGAGGGTAVTLFSIVSTLNLTGAAGIKFTGTLTTITKSSGLADVTVNNASTPSFNIPDLSYTEFVEFKVGLSSDCGSLPLVKSGTKPTIPVNFAYTGGTGAYTKTSLPFEILKPSLSIPKVTGNFDPTSNTLDAGAGVTDSLTVQVTNAGSGILTEFIYWVKDHPQLTLQNIKVGNVIVPAMGTSGDTTFFKITTAMLAQAFQGTGSPTNNMGTFQFNESLNIKEIWYVDDCKLPAADIQHGVRYGCDNSLFPKCEEAVKNTGVRFGLLRPVLVNDWYYGFGDPYPGCGIAIAGQYLTNTGRVKATEINFDLKFWVPEYPGTGSLDLDNMYVQKKSKATGILGPLTKVTASSLIEAVSNGCSPSTTTYRGAAIKLTSAFDLLPGDTLFVKWQQLPECQQACNPAACEITANNYALFGHAGISTSNYTDPCKLQTYLITYRYQGSLYSRMPYFAEAPSTIDGGQIGTYTMTLTDFNIWKYTNHGSTRTDAQGNKNISSYPRRRIQFIYTNDIGLDWNRGATDFTWTDNQGDKWTPTSVRYIDHQTDSGDTLIVTYTGNWPANFNPAASNTIKVNYLADCSEVPVCTRSKVANISSIIRFMADSTCTDCAGSIGDVIGCKSSTSLTVRCPTCDPCAGLTPISFNIERTNFEFPDNTNDYRPDASGAINKNMVALNRAIAGDTVVAKYKGVFGTSVNHTQWENAYNLLQLPSGLGLTFTPIGGSLKIVDTDGVGATIGTYTSNILQQYPSGNDVITNISPSNVASLSTTDIPASFTSYGNGDTVYVEVKLVVADNTFNRNNDGNVFKSVDVGDASFASHVSIAQTNKPNIGTNIPNTEYKDRYQCDVVTSRFYYIEMYHNLESGDNSYPGGCTEGNMGYDWEGMFIGVRTVDYFPFEYRTPKGNVTVSKFVKRSDFIYTKVEWQIYAKDYIGRPYKVGDVPLNSGNYGSTLGATTTAVHYGVLPMDSPYVQVVGDTVYTYIDKFLKDNFGSIVADEGYRVFTRPYYVASCATVKSGQNAIRHYPYYNFKLDDKVFGYSALNNVSRYTFYPTDVTYYGKPYATLGYGYAGGPNLILQTSSAQQDLIGSEACFQVDIINTTDYVANNTWATFTNSSGSIQIKSIKEINPSTGAVINTPTKVLGIYQLGNTAAASSGGVPKVRRFEICVYSDNCNRDSIKVNTGWDCLGYPKTVEEAACNAPVYLYTNPIKAELDMIIKEPIADVTAQLCNEQEYIVQLSSAILGTLNNINLQYEMPSGMTMVPGSFQYLYPSPVSGNPLDAAASAWVTAPNQPSNTFGTTYLVNVTDQGHPILSTTGLVGTTDIGKNLMFVKFKVKTECNYMSGSPINFLSWAYDACDKLTNYRFSPSKKLLIQGAPDIYRTEITVDPTSLNPCKGEKKTISAGFSILPGSVATTGDDSVRVLLPPGMAYSQMISMNAAHMNGPTTKIENGQQIIYWKINPGLTGGTSVNWSFEITSSDAAQTCNKPYEIVVQTFRSSSAACNGVTCSIRVLSDEARGNVSFIKPNLSIVSFGASSKAMPPSQEEVTYNIKIQNDGEAIPAGTVTKIEVYSDNGNGDVGTGDVLLFTATTTDAIPSGGVAILSGSALVSAGTTCSLIAMVNPLTTCTCSRIESFVIHPTLDVPFSPRQMFACSNTTTATFGPPVLTNHTYEWIAINGANLTALSSKTSSPITFKLRNTGTTNQTHTYVLRTMRNNDCYVFDTLSVTVYPEIADSTTFTVCKNADFKLAGPSNGTAFLWTPTTSLSSATDPQATVVGGVAAISRYTLNYLDANGCPAVYIAKINITDCGATALGDTVWYDKNANGLQEVAEPGIEGIVVYLYAGSNTSVPISSTTTNSAGYYLFNNLPQGYYSVGFVLPNGGVFTTKDAGSNTNDTKDSDADPVTGLAPQVFISNGVKYPDYDAGIVYYEYGDAPNTYKTSSASGGAKHLIVDGLKLGNLIDGDADAHSPAVTGSNAIGDDTADGNDDEDGITSFDVLNTLTTTYTVAVNATNTTALAANLVGWIDFNRNGTFETTEGVSVAVPTGTTNGIFNLTYTIPSNILGGLTYARFRLSSDAALTTATPAGTVNSGEVEDYELTIITLKDWGDNPDSYQTDAVGVSGPSHKIVKSLFLGTLVDDETDGIPAAAGANSTGDDLNKASNDEDGVTFPVITPGATSYSATIKATNTGSTAAKVVGWIDFNNNTTYQTNESATVSVPAGTNNGTFTLNFTVPNTAVLTVNELLYARFRLTSDATITSATPGGEAVDGEVEDYDFIVSPCIKPSAGKDTIICDPKSTIKLKAANSTELWYAAASNPAVASITANGDVTGMTVNGDYQFILQYSSGCTDTVIVTRTNVLPNVGAGTTKVINCTNPQVQLDGTSTTPNVSYLWTTTDGTIVSGATTLTPTISAAGTYKLTVTSLISGCSSNASVTITGDANLPNAGPDVERVCTGGGNVLYATLQGQPIVSAGGGEWQYVSGPAGGTLNFNDIHSPTSGVNTTTPGTYVYKWVNLTNLCADQVNIDMPSCYGSIGDYVWFDANADGIQDAAEMPIAGIAVHLLKNGVVVRDTTTDANGLYLFDKVLSGTYQVKFDAPIGYNGFSKQNATADDAKDNDINDSGLSQFVVVDATKLDTDTLRNNPNVDAGLIRYGSIGNYVWFDANADGIQDATETPIQGVTVNLLNASGAILQTTTTSATGLYEFDSLLSNTYKIQIVAPVGYNGFADADKGGDDTKDSDFTDAGMSPNIIIDVTKTDADVLRNNPTIDAGLIRYGSIGNYVWFDANANGIQDATETPIAGVTVNLLNASGTILQTTTTSATGLYEFDSLLSNTYKIQIVVPTGYNGFADADKGGDDTKDSDFTDAGMSPNIIIDVTKTDADILRNNPTIDAGLIRYGSIGNYVWFDANADGIQDATETPIAGVTVNLLNASGTILQTTTTSATGLYEFDSLLSNTYKIQIVVPTGYNGFADADKGGDDTKDSDFTDAGMSPNIVIDVTKTDADVLRNNPTIDAGLIRYGSIGNYVWFDANADGIQDATETPIAGVTVNLLNSSGTILQTTTTSATGLYEFDSLLSNTYKIQIVAPVGYNGFADADKGGDDTKDSDFTDAGMGPNIIIDVTKTDADVLRNNPTIDAGLIRYGSIGNYVWFDANADGIQDAGEAAVQGAGVYLLTSAGILVQNMLTDAAGHYEFDSLLAGNYKVRIFPPAGYNGFTEANSSVDDKDSDFANDGYSPIITIDITKDTTDLLRNNPTIDAGLLKYGTIGNYVWFDANANGVQDISESGIQGITVNLLNASGTILQTTLTSASGLYEFDSLLTGNYQVQIIAPVGYNGFTDVDKGGDDNKDNDFGDAGLSSMIPIDISKDATHILKNNPTIDAGLVRYGSIGNYVWFDANANGVQDAAESPLQGITVNLLDASGAVLQTTTTSATGLYEFDSLLSNTYKVQVIAPVGYNGFADADKGGDDTKDSDFTDAGMSPNITIDVTKTDADILRNNPTIDAGLIRYGSIGNYVWFDANADGVQDVSELGVQGVVVNLLDASGAILQTTTTSATGLYEFDSLLSNTYKIQIVAPVGYNGFADADKGGDDTKDSDFTDAGMSPNIIIDVTKTDADILRNNLSIDAGLIRYGSIGNYVWFDVNANGIQDATETPIAGVTVNLLNASGTILQTSTTSATGLYEFDSLLSSTYQVQIIAPTGYNGFADIDKGGDDTKDSDFTDAGMSPNITIDVTKTDADILRNNPTIDAGLIRYGSIGNYVWLDGNVNGIQDATESPIVGMTVQLLNSSGVVIQTVLTSNTGFYEFDSLISGNYQVKFVQPADYNGFTITQAGGDATKDNDISNTGISASITIDVTKDATDILRNNPTIDAGLIRYGSIGNYVWFDENANGVQDATETPLANITVNLYDASNNIIQTTKTNASGLYVFDTLATGNYKVGIVLPTGYDGLADVNKIADDTKDNDFDDLGFSPVISIDVSKIQTDILRNNLTVDAGLIRYGSLGNYVWFDENGDGIQNATEKPIAGVTVNLLYAAGGVVQTTTTDAAGHYSFDSLTTNNYRVQIIAPLEYSGFTKANAIGDDAQDSDFDVASLSHIITLDASKDANDILRNNPTIDAGLIRIGSIGNYVWYDENANGIQESTETPVANVTVNLLDNAGNILKTTITNSNGFYLFDSLLTNSYRVQVVTPANYDGFTTTNLGANDTKDSDFGKTGLSHLINLDTSKEIADTLRNNPNIDAGLVRFGSIGNYVWFDSNKDGIQASTETPVPNLTVYLLNSAGQIIESTLTDASGLYKFDSLLSGNYFVKFALSSNYDGFTTANLGGDDTKDSDADANGMSPVIVINTKGLAGSPERDNTSIDAGLLSIGSLGDYVWYDKNGNGVQETGEPPIAGVEVELLNSGGTVIATTTTDVNGFYLFGKLVSGTYQVRFIEPTGYNGFTAANKGTNDKLDSDVTPSGLSHLITIDITKTDTLRNNPQVDAGLLKFGSLGDFVWFDKNADGIQDIAEVGVPNMTIYLLDASGNKLDSTQTDANGKYLFDSLSAGTYKVQFIEPTGYDGFTKKDNTATTEATDSVVNTLGITDAIIIDPSYPATNFLRNNTRIDAGLVKYGSIGNVVWFDKNRDGIQDAGEPPITGVKVNLYDKNGTLISSILTDANGYYEFDSLLAGEYRIEFEKPAGYDAFTSPNAGSNDGIDSDPNELGLVPNILIDTDLPKGSTGRDNFTIYAGLIVGYGSIGNYVWIDDNHDGIQDATEVGVEGVRVYLLNASGNKIDSTLTDNTGKYLFDKLESGSYKVQFKLPLGYDRFTDANKPSDDAKDSDVNAAGLSQNITIDTSKPQTDTLRNNPNIDAGLILSFGQIGDLVWFDKNGDGIQNIDEIPVVGVKVYLLNALGVKIDSAVTDSSGKYLFDGLLTGNYRVQFSLPTGYDSFSASNKGTDDAKDSDVTSTGLSHLIKIDTSKPMSDTLRSNLNIDAGLLRYGSIGNYVWLDANANGVQDATESPIAAVKVYLLNAGGNIIDSTITNNAGYYSFEKLLYGNYQVKFIQPIGYEGFTKANAANDDTKDSDINASGLSHNILIDTSKPLGDTLRNNPNIDAGLVRFGSISNFVWFDVNGNGIQDNTEKGVAGITVKLLDQNGNVIATTLTDATGNYLFDSLASGNYRVKIDVPSTFDGVSKQNAGTNDAFDNDFNSTGLSHLITIDTSKPESDTLRNNPNIDAGLVKFGSIGDYVWLDVNKDGTQAATELPVANIRVFLLDVNKNKIDTTNTDNNGEYLFDKLVSGTYYVSFDVPTGYNITKANVGDDTKDSDANASGLSHAITIDVTKALSDTLRTNPNIDLGLIAIGSLGNYVWYDLDKDGRQDSGEPAVSGIKVYLLNASGIKIDSAITDASGKYSFYNLESGQYRVKFEVPKGTITTLSNAVEDTDDSDVDGSGLTSLITIDTSQPIINLQRNNPTIDMGLIAVGSIGDYVWFDTDKDGTQDAAETGLAGVTVNLLDAEGKVIVSTTTDANGKYLFSNLSSGTYQVQFVAPSGKVFTQANLAGDNIDSDANTDGKTGLIVIDATKPLGSPLRDNKDVDAGFINQVIPYGSIGDLVWSDKDADGIQDANETGVANVKVYLLDANGKKIDSTLTDQFGKYLFDSLINGNYQVQFVLPNGTSFSPANATNDTQDSDAGIGGKSPIITINTSLPVGDAGRNNLTVDAGLIPPYGSIGDYVFLDNDDSKTQTTADTPVAGIKVYLLNAAGNKIDSTITNASGLYKFDSLLSGLYSVQFVAPNGKTFITKDTGTDDKDSDADSNGKTGTYFVDTNKPAGDPTRDITSVDAGFAPEKPILYGSIGDRVWNDTNSNGTQDGAETGVPNVKVYLLNALGVKIDSTITDANGKYLFDSLLAGTYSVQFITPSGKNFTNGNIGNDATDSDADATGKTSAVTVDTSKPLGDSARNITSVDAGLVTPYGSIGDKVWNDTNRDGIQDATETGVPNVKVYLLNASGVKIDSTITDANGKYVFDSLTSGTYSVQFVAPSGNQFTNANIGNDATDSDADAIGKTAPITLDTSKPVGDPARNITSVDAGLVKEIISYGSIGDKVWNDTNRDGVQDANEVGVANVKVYLLNASGVKIDSTITDANGKYLFDSLVTGSYSVQFVAPTGNNFTLANSTGDTIDSDVDATGKTAAISINTSFPIGDTRRDNRDTDAGLVKPLIPYGSIGDRVWDDTNRDGVQDANEVGVANVKVYLLSASGVKIDSTITDANGKYLFDSLTSGTYSVQFVAPTGTNFTVANSTGDTVDSDADATGKTSPITLDTSKPVGDPARNITSVDAGLVKPLIPYGSIGDKVWNDTNKDGVQDANEIGVLNVKVYLLNANGVRIDSTITDVNGKYLFDSLVTGTYSVQFVSPAGMAFTLANSTGDSIDSDAGTDGKTSSISINTSYPAGDTRRDNRDSDAGLVGVIPKVFDLALTKKLAQGQSATLKAGNLVKFTLTVINQGNVDATNIQISDNVPAGLTLADSNWTLNGSKATMKTPIVLLAAGQLTARDIVFKVGSVTGSITNIAEISSATGGTDKDSTPDDNFTNDGTPKNDEINENGKTGGDEDDSDIETITVIPEIITKAKVHVLKTVNQNVINVGDVVTYTISVWNDGNKDTTGVEVTEALYAGAAYVSSTANNGFYNAATKIWKIGNLIAKGDTAKLTVKVKVVSSGIWFNSAIIKDAEKADSSTVCVSTLLRLCSERNESIVLTSNETYSTYQWYKDNQLIVGANSKIYTAKAAGSYTVRPIGVAPSTCPSGTCCPIVVVDVCECKAEVCIPMSIKKIK